MALLAGNLCELSVRAADEGEKKGKEKHNKKVEVASAGG